MAVKTFEEHRKHFILRTKDRYNIDVQEDEYVGLCKSFQGIYKKNANNTIGFVFHKGEKIWCLYGNKTHALSTAYPADIEFDGMSAIRACFPKVVKPFAEHVYKAYLNEKEDIAFKNNKEMAMYYHKYKLFPKIHIGVYVFGRLDLFKLMFHIGCIIKNESKYVRIEFVKSV